MFRYFLMSVSSQDLEKAIKKYIDSEGVDGRQELRQLLQQTSSVVRYSLLMNVRGDKCSTVTGPHLAAAYYDLETIKFMLEGFTGDHKYEVLNTTVLKVGQHYTMQLAIASHQK